MPKANRKSTPQRPRKRSTHCSVLSSAHIATAITANPDAPLFTAAAEWRIIWQEMSIKHVEMLASEKAGSRRSAGFIEASKRLAAAEAKLIAIRPKTSDGAAVLLEVAAEYAPKMPSIYALVAAAVRGAIAVGI